MIEVDEEFLVRVFNTLYGELHSPRLTDCDACLLMKRIEDILGRKLVDTDGELA
jgi:hypothetical protein